MTFRSEVPDVGVPHHGATSVPVPALPAFHRDGPAPYLEQTRAFNQRGIMPAIVPDETDRIEGAR